MLNSSFLHYAFVLLYKYRYKHFAIFVLSTLVVFIISSVVFISSSLQHDLERTLEHQSEIIVERLRSGERSDMPNSYSDTICEINGVQECHLRVHGKYFYEPNGAYFEIIGVDVFDEQSIATLQKLVEKLDIKEFLAQNNMIVGSSVKQFMKEHYYTEYFNFKTPHAKSIKVHIYDVLGASNDMVTSGMIIMPQELAKEILGIEEEYSSDLVLNVSNPLEIDTIKNSIILEHFDVRVITKEDITQAYAKLYDFKGGVFLSLYIVVLMSFLLLLYQKYSSISSNERKEVAILRSIGWSMKDVMTLKIFESSFLLLSSFLLGVVLSFVYIYFADAPLLAAIFVGFNNLDVVLELTPVFDFGMFSILFFFYATPYLAVSLLPVWRAAALDPNEVLR